MLKKATTDSLTGQLDRDALHLVLEQEIERCIRYGSRFSVILFDVDYFKLINDTHGMEAGDRVLREVSEISANAIRQVDYLGRWAGDEFLFVLPDTDTQSAVTLAERLCCMVKERDFGAAGHITASFGVTTYHPGQNLEDVVHHADRAVNQAKQNGRGLTAVMLSD